MRAPFVPLLLLLATACLPGEDAPAAGAPSPDPAARTGGALVVGIDAPDSIDPALAHRPPELLIARTMCDTLIESDPLTGELRPGLAESWTVSGRGTRLSLDLREDARFHDGSAMGAEDVVFSLSRLASEELASPSASLLEPVFGYAEQHGDAEADDEASGRIRGVRATGGHAVEIVLSGSLAEFVAVLAHPATAPVPRERVENDPEAFARRPSCIGPYRPAAPWGGTGPLLLERTDGYQGEGLTATRGGAGYADAIEFRTFPDRAAAAAAFGEGLDVAAVPEADDPAAPEGARTVAEPTSLVELIGLPTGVEPFDRPEVRAALSASLDREAIAAITGDLPADRFVALGDTDTPCLDQAAPADPGLRGRTLRLYFNDEFRNRAVAEAVAEQWRSALGVGVDVVPLGWEAIVERGTGTAGLDGAFRFAWAPTHPSPDAVLRPLFHSGAIGRDNWSRYSSGPFDDSIRDARRAAGAEDRAAAYDRAEAIVCDDLPMLPLLRDTKQLFVRDRIASASGRFVDVTYGQPLVRELFVR